MAHETLQPFPTTEETSVIKHHSTRRSVASEFQQISDAPSHLKRLRSDSAWALKLKEAIDAAEHTLHVQVTAAIPVCIYEPENDNDMLFELQTDHGRLNVTRTRSGKLEFKWL